jgi:hypothetical protein
MTEIPGAARTEAEGSMGARSDSCGASTQAEGTRSAAARSGVALRT